jgi:hypothetical protein
MGVGQVGCSGRASPVAACVLVCLVWVAPRVTCPRRVCLASRLPDFGVPSAAPVALTGGGQFFLAPGRCSAGAVAAYARPANRRLELHSSTRGVATTSPRSLVTLPCVLSASGSIPSCVLSVPDSTPPCVRSEFTLLVRRTPSVLPLPRYWSSATVPERRTSRLASPSPTKVRTPCANIGLCDATAGGDCEDSRWDRGTKPAPQTARAIVRTLLRAVSMLPTSRLPFSGQPRLADQSSAHRPIFPIGSRGDARGTNTRQAALSWICYLRAPRETHRLRRRA